jgi:biotin operon repressor
LVAVNPAYDLMFDNFAPGEQIGESLKTSTELVNYRVS